MVRTVYEIRTFEALCAQLRCKGIWVVGADEFRNPDEDLVSDFAEHRTEHYAELRKPLDPGVFVSQLRDEMRAEMQALVEALAIQIANATFAARQRWIWGEGSTAVSSDSTHFGAWDQNIFTEWHSRYGTGVRTGSRSLTLAA